MDELDEVVKNLKEQCASVRPPTPKMHISTAGLPFSASCSRIVPITICISQPQVYSSWEWSLFARLKGGHVLSVHL